MHERPSPHGPSGAPVASWQLTGDQLDAGKHQRPGADLGRTGAVPWAPRHGVGLCLSGGGYRAALFHLGALRRLDELGILGRVRTVSGVSGGSIPANLLSDPRLVWPSGEGTDLRVGGFDEYVAAPLLRLTATNVRTPAILARLRPDQWFVPDGGVRAMADQLAAAVEWWSRPLAEVGVHGPATVTGATDLAYGVDWRFWDPAGGAPRGWMGDYRLGFCPLPPWLRVADVVATSAAFPPVFGPRRMDGRGLGLTGGVAGRESSGTRQAIVEDIRLSDGGVYDNLGLEPVWKNHRSVLVSDGGDVFRARSYRTPVGLVLRALLVSRSGGTAIRLRWLHSSMARGEIDGATWSLADVEGCSVEVADAISDVRTDLDAFGEGEQQVIERHGYLVTDALVRRHAPHLVVAEAPLRPPHPGVATPEAALAALAGSERRRVLGRRTRVG